MNIKTIKFIGMAATVIGATMSVVASWASDKQMDVTISEKVAKALNNVAETSTTEAN